MKSCIAAPSVPITSKPYSHRSAQAYVWADVLNNMGEDVEILTSDRSSNIDWNEYDRLYVYHGNDWSPGRQINLFGDLDKFPYARNVRNFTQFRGEVFSLYWDMPDYHKFLCRKVELFDKRKDPSSMQQEFREMDLDNLRRMCETARTIDPWVSGWNLVLGDSHAISLYRPGWNVISIPFRTLHGALKRGLESLLPEDRGGDCIDLYFGNIDIRHHVCRMSDKFEAIDNLVREYVRQADELPYEKKRIMELLPIESESRRIPSTGLYEGKPFHGSWEERNTARLYFMERVAAECEGGNSVEVCEWVPPNFYNDKGELTFDVMEKPASVHLSREHYPFWTGINKRTRSLEDFFE